MSDYLAFWRQYADFQGKTTRRGFWTALFVWYSIAFVLLIASCLMGLLLLHLSPDEATHFAKYVLSAYFLATIMPLLAITVRRLRSAGYGPKSFLWLLLPGFGMIAFVARLCTKAK